MAQITMGEIQAGVGRESRDTSPGAEERYNAWQDGVVIDQAPRVLEAMTGLARERGWTVREVADLNSLPTVRPAGKATGVTLYDSKTIGIKAGLTPGAKVYVLAHELGHALGTMAKMPISGVEALQLAMGAITRRDVPAIKGGEAEAEVVSMLVLSALGAEVNFSYLANWEVPAEVIGLVAPGAERLAAEILEAIHAEVGEERAAA